MSGLLFSVFIKLMIAPEAGKVRSLDYVSAVKKFVPGLE